jgi:hypothetical protein
VTWRSVRSRAPTGRTCASMQRQASSFRPGQPHAHGHRAHLRPDRWRWGLRRCYLQYRTAHASDRTSTHVRMAGLYISLSPCPCVAFQMVGRPSSTYSIYIKKTCVRINVWFRLGANNNCVYKSPARRTGYRPVHRAPLLTSGGKKNGGRALTTTHTNISWLAYELASYIFRTPHLSIYE